MRRTVVVSTLGSAGALLFPLARLPLFSVGSWHARDGGTARIGLGVRAEGAGFVAVTSTIIAISAFGTH